VLAYSGVAAMSAGYAQPMDDDTVMLRFKDMAVFLHKADAAQEPLPEVLVEARKGAGQFAIIVDDVDAVWSELAAREAEVLSGPADRPGACGRSPWPIRAATSGRSRRR
jgi:hypothetical protein